MEPNRLTPDALLRRRAKMGNHSTGRPVQPHCNIDGAALRRLRIAANISGATIARELHVATNTYHCYENLTSRPSRRSVAIIAAILNCQPEDFLK